MAELDLSLSDALTDSVPQPGLESAVERDFVAQLEAETFDDQVKETVGKTDYIPLLDNDDTRADAGAALENGEPEAHGVQKPGCKLTSGGEVTASHLEPQGEVRPHSLDQQASRSDFLSAFSQPGGMGVNVEVGVAPLQAERPPSIADPQDSNPPAGSDAPKEHSPMQPEPQAPRSPLDLSAGAIGDCWPDQTGCLSTDAPFTPSISVMFDKEAGQLIASPDDQPDSWPSRECAAYAGGDERDGDGSDRKQKKKKKRRQKDEGSYEHLESRGHPKMQSMGENTPPAEEFYHRIGPRRDRVEGGWEEQLGKSGGRGKRGKNRKKLPEEWAVMAEAFVPSSAVSGQLTEEVMLDLENSAQANLETSMAEMDTSQSPWKTEVDTEEGSNPISLSQDAATISPLALNSELKATAAPFTMPSSTNKAALDSFPKDPSSSDPYDLLMETENASLGHSNQAFSPPFSPENKAVKGDMVDSGIFDTTHLHESPVQGLPEGDTSAFSSASQTSFDISPKGEVLASAPPLSPTDASWLLNDSHMSSNTELFDLGEMSTSGHPLPLGLSFDTPSPAPLRSPKTTAQEFQSKEQKDAKSNQKQSRKSRSSSSSSSVKSPTSPEEKKFFPQVSPVSTPISPPSVTLLGTPGSGLNPAAKPFFPSFADPMEEPAVPHQVVPIMEVKSDKTEKVDEKEEKLEDSVKKVEPSDSQDKPEQKSVKIEYTSSETPAKVEKEVEKVKEKEKDYKAENIKQEQQEITIKKTEKEVEMVNENQLNEKREVERSKEKEKVEADQQKEVKEDKMPKEEEPTVKADNIAKMGEDEIKDKVESKHEKAENVKKMDNNEKSKLEDEAENKATEKTEKEEMKNYKEHHIDKVETTTEQQLTATTPDPDITQENTEKKAEVETKTVADAEEEEEERDNAKKDKEMEEDKVGKLSEEPVGEAAERIKKVESQDKLQDDKKTAEKKVDKKEKAAKIDGGEKARKPGKPAANESNAAQSKDQAGGDKKTKPAAGVTKPALSGKTRLNPTAASGSATTKRPTPSSTTTATEKKPATQKSPCTTGAGPKRPSVNASSRPSSSSTTTTTRDVKAKATTEKRALVPKANTTASNQTGSAAATKNGTATTPTSKTAPSVRTTASTRTATTAAAKKPLGSKTDSKPGEEKKPSTLKTSTADSTKPKMSTTTRTTTSTTAAFRNRTTTTKPAAPSSTTGTVPEKKPSVPRTAKPTSSGTSASTATLKPTARPNTAPAPGIRNARAKTGSSDNMKQQPGGGKVPSVSQNKGITSKEPSQGKVQILNKKVDVSKVTSKCGSKDNIKHKPGGGAVKIESHKINFREKAQSKVGSMENVSHTPGGGNIKAEGAQEATEESGTLLSGSLAPGPELRQAGSPAAQENGLKDGAPCDNEGLQEPQGLDSHIPETN